MPVPRPSAALVVASLALLIADAQPGYAALSSLAKNSVGSPQIKNGSVQTDDLAKKSVTSAAIKNGAVKQHDLDGGSVGSAQLANGTVAGADLAPGSVDYSKIADGTVGRAELSGNAVDGSKVVDGSLALADLGAAARPTKAVVGTWTKYAPATWATMGTLTTLGALSTDGTGALALGQPTVLLVSGSLRVRTTPGATATASLDCSVYVNGASIGPTANLAGLAAGASTTMPITGTAPLTAGTFDVSANCNGSNAQVQLVRVTVVALPS